MKLFFIGIALFIHGLSFTQYKSSLPANEWVDSVFQSLSKKKKIAQLIIIRAHSNLATDHVEAVADLIKKYDVGGLCFFQGGPLRQANLTNFYQSISKTPLLISMDAEWGLGMRLDSVINFPRQMMMGAVTDAKLIYKVGTAIGEQCKRMSVHLNFAPVVDINNNAANPVINDRSFGENKFKVASFGIQYMKGMQDQGVMACAKHFPGHGDVTADSHFDLPIINKTKAQLDSLELFPFREMMKANVASMMVAHLYIPSIDTTANLATSLSYKNVTGLLKNDLGYKGLIITDGLEMKGVTKYFPDGEVSVKALAAGNDMLCLPEDVLGSIQKIKKAIRKHIIDKKEFEQKVKKVLFAKYNTGLYESKSISTDGLTEALNVHTNELKKEVAVNAITLLKKTGKDIFPINIKKRIAYVGIGIDTANVFAKKLQQEYALPLYFFSYKKDSATAESLVKALQEQYEEVIIGIHNFSRRPANNFGISRPAYYLINKMQSSVSTVTLVFGNPYAIKNISNTSANLLACYEDDDVTQAAAADMVVGKITAKGILPVTVSEDLPLGTGIHNYKKFTYTTPEEVGMQSDTLNEIDSIANDAIAKHATPGCVVLVAKNGKVAFHRAYGYTNYDRIEPTTKDMVYDLASVTKISATTLAVMKLFETGLLDINKTLGDYLPWVKGSDKENLLIKNVLLHQAGLKAWIPFYRETLDKDGYPLPTIYRNARSDSFSVRVAENIYMRNDWRDTMYARMLQSKLGMSNKYEYSDNDFIFMGKIVEAITKKPLDVYLKETFYSPLGLSTTTFHPLNYFAPNKIAPTERDKNFRQQLLRGDVHDPAAAMLGGVAGHAGLFSNAFDLAQLYQMLLNGGEMDGVRYLKKETIDTFTAYGSEVSRRGLGFDKPEKDNETRPDPYPAPGVPLSVFGHTGFTGICVWADPENDLLYIFLSNRVTPDAENNKLQKMKVRANIQEVIYKSLMK